MDRHAKIFRQPCAFGLSANPSPEFARTMTIADVNRTMASEAWKALGYSGSFDGSAGAWAKLSQEKSILVAAKRYELIAANPQRFTNFPTLLEAARKNVQSGYTVSAMREQLKPVNYLTDVPAEMKKTALGVISSPTAKILLTVAGILAITYVIRTVKR